ncbi:MAG TPA: sigma 54-interacting transcriptional regulator [Gemmatimonadaceae bacterium]|nr:sigma 54-interacting transcriptional regulator [Gemmatimonadaceae bacterium]
MTSIAETWARLTLADFDSADAPMRACLDLARVAAQTDLPVLILGESGTGKTLLARAIHNSSRRAGASFVAFNAAALSDTLLDSQLFGHDRGAFTGAVRAMKGKFELADGGTLFIDEIADMTAAAQAKILRAVECGEFERLGSEMIRTADVRLISATHLPLQRYIEAAHFRKDLFYRISGITVAIPALRERPNDLRALVAREIAAASEADGKKIIGLDRRAAERLLAHHWPGNLRELKRVIHSAVAMSTGAVITADAILLEGVRGRTATDAPIHAPPQRDGDTSSRPTSLDEDLTLRAVELRHVHRVLELMHGNKRRAARALGLSRTTLDRKLGEMASPGRESRP